MRTAMVRWSVSDDLNASAIVSCDVRKEEGATDWFDPSNDVIVEPASDAARFWRRTYGTDTLEVSEELVFANNGHGRLFDAICQRMDRKAEVRRDHRERGYVHYYTRAGSGVTICRAPEPAPWAAHHLELLIAAGARKILFVNGAGALRPDLVVGSVLLPCDLVREEGTSFHYAASDVALRTTDTLRSRLREIAASLGIAVMEGDHWTTDAIYRETRGKVARLRAAGVHSVDMELSALMGVAHFRRCELAAVHVVTDVLMDNHSWCGVETAAFHAGAGHAADIAAAFA